MIQRVLTALVLIPTALALVWWAPGWLFLLGVLPFALLALWEYLEMAGRTGGVPARWAVYLVAVCLLLVAAFRHEHLLAAIVGGSLLVFAAAIVRREGLAEVLSAGAAGVFGLLYIAVPFALVLELRAREQGPRVVLYLLLLVWVGDTAAYFAGRAFGRHQLAPTVSPGKTVEGTVASLVAAVALGFWLFRRWFGDFGPAHAFLLPVVVNVVAQFGDLAESALKRSAGVKDSSALLPGHGGVLDRVDALLFAVPALWYYWSLLTQGAP